jgi:hypothetical protein
LRHIERQAQLHVWGCMIPRKGVKAGVKGVHPCVMCKLVYACLFAHLAAATPCCRTQHMLVNNPNPNFECGSVLHIVPVLILEASASLCMPACFAHLAAATPCCRTQHMLVNNPNPNFECGSVLHIVPVLILEASATRPEVCTVQHSQVVTGNQMRLDTIRSEGMHHARRVHPTAPRETGRGNHTTWLTLQDAT